MSLPVVDADILRDVVLAERPTTVIEIGLAYGSSALAIAEALVAAGTHDVRHLIIDAHQDHFARAGWDEVVGVGLGGVCSLLEERSQLALPQLVADGVTADAAFVDGSHVFHNVFVDLCFLCEVVRPGGLVVMDDCGWPSVATAARYYERNVGWERLPMPQPTRLCAFRLPDPRRDPDFRSFTPFGTDEVTGARSRPD